MFKLTTSTIGGCLGQWGEVNSSWYVVYVDPTSAANATLTFTISPSNGTDDYDYSIWKGATCTLGAPNSCNFSSTVGNTGLATGSASTSQGVGGTTWNAPLVTQPGDVYIVLINGYTPSSTSFNFNFGGAAILGCNPPPILPIELLSFVGQNKGAYNMITWTTASEINNDYFILERSANGANFEELKKIKGEGNSSKNFDYSYTDMNPKPGVNYYRLKQTDYNGVSKTFKIITVDNILLSKGPIYILNSLGQNVDENYKGIIFLYYENGMVIKKVNY